MHRRDGGDMKDIQGIEQNAALFAFSIIKYLLKSFCFRYYHYSDEKIQIKEDIKLWVLPQIEN